MATATTGMASRRSTLIPIPAGWRTWRFDTRAIVGGVLLAVCFSANMQITERIDTATTGGAWPWGGILFQCVWFSAATFFFGLGAGLIAAWFNPVVAILTATGPLAPAWFGTNGSFVITFAVLMRNWLTRYKEVGFWQFFWTVWLANTPPGFVIMAVQAFLLHFSWPVVLLFFVGNQLVTIPGAILSYYFARYVSRSGIAA